jgi:hypothetical protein
MIPSLNLAGKSNKNNMNMNKLNFNKRDDPEEIE